VRLTLNRLRRPGRPPEAPAPTPPVNRFISPELAGVARERLRMPEAFAPLAAPPVFITGHGRSGTTWTFDLFALHPEVCAIFETWLLGGRPSVVGVFRQPQWMPDYYSERVRDIGLEHCAVQLLPYEEMARELGELVAGWMMRAVQPGQRYLVEKGPLEIAAADAMFPEARVIHVLRDGRDVALSSANAARSWAPEMDAGRTIASFVGDWRAGVESIRAAGAPLGEQRYLEIRFEDLRADAAAAARRLFAFAGIPCDDELAQRIAAETSLSRYDPAVRESGFRGQGLAGGWRERLSRDEARAVDETAGDLLVDLGYERDRDWWRSLP
jgi:hypothetical protein